ncbi:hypothetical protein PAHAL_1G069900 [Panicum hallii]|uniref:Uncharacterized protein n=1 Tax=Panicum hallii TaxID=206008 RepID=A0A2S3GM10_9POAL|nr:hypothetical protein PAHAL_1G069900 [Panicum hallii]
MISTKNKKKERRKPRPHQRLLLHSLGIFFLDDAQRPLQPRRRRRRGELLVPPRWAQRHPELPQRLLVELLVEEDVVLAAFVHLLAHRHDAHGLLLAAAAAKGTAAPPVTPPLGAGRQRRARAHGQRGHVGRRQRLLEHGLREHEVYLPRPEQVAGGQRRRVPVEVERVGVAHEERLRRVAAAAEHVGDAGRRGGRELLQRAVGGDEPGRRRRGRLVRLPPEAALMDARKLQSHGILKVFGLRFRIWIRWLKDGLGVYIDEDGDEGKKKKQR